MSENKDITFPDLAKDAPNDSKSHEVIRLKFSKREEMLDKLTSLMTLAFEKASSTNIQSRHRQKWITICGYLAQVAARIVTDLQYEKLRSDIDLLVEQVLDANVRQRRAVRR
jgi:hypothetical protein